MAICGKCGNPNPDDAKFCNACAAPLTSETGLREVRKNVTVLFSDVIGSTSIGELLDPEPLRGLMTRYYEEMKQVLERHEGTVRELIGDAVMAVFGTPVAHEDDALRAVRAAAEMSERLVHLNDELERDWGVRLSARTGVNTGEVVAGGRGESQSLVLGDSVNVAARLEQAAQPGEILLGETTYRLVRDAVQVEPLGAPLPLKGKTEPVRAWRLLSVTPAPALDRRLDSPLVGRGRELELLQQAFERAANERSCELVTVLGPAGVGKSRLTEEFVTVLGERATVLSGRCLPYGDGITFWPIAEVVRQATATTETDPPGAVRAKIDALLRETDDAELIAERVAGAIGLADADADLSETFWSIRKLLESLARERPLVCVFDDIHWAEPTFLDLVEHLAGGTGDVPLLLLCLARPELLESRPEWPTGPEVTSVTLTSLSDEESRRLIGNLLGRSKAADELSRRVVAAAEGNPLFVEELLRMLVDDGVLEREDGHWRATRDLAELSLPPTIQALLAARLERLVEAEREVVQRASVIGKVFWRGAVAELTPERARPDVGSHLQTLVRKELIESDPTTFAGEDGFRFGHILVRDAAYRSIPKMARAELHERFADWLEHRAGERASEYEEIVGYHLEHAFRYGSEFGPADERRRELAVRAGERLASAGLRARARGDMAAAANLLARAVALLPADSARRLEVMLKLADALVDTGDLSRADAVLAEIQQRAAAAGSKATELLAELERVSLQQYTAAEANQAEIAALAKRAILVLEEAEDDAALARAWGLLGDVHAMACHYRERADALEQALAHAERAGDEREVTQILAMLATSLYLGSTPAAEGIRRCKQIVERAGKGLPEPSALAGFHAMEGRFEDARRIYRRGQSFYEDLGRQLTVAARTVVGGAIEVLAGDLVAADRELRRGTEELDAMGEKNIFSTVAGMLARVLYAQGRYAEAEEFAAVGQEAAASDDIVSQALWRSAQGMALARRGEFEQAERFARDAVDLMAQTDQLDGHGDALLDLAEVLRLAGREHEAAQFAERALGLYEQKGNLVSAEKARAFLAELRQKPVLQ